MFKVRVSTTQAVVAPTLLYLLISVQVCRHVSAISYGLSPDLLNTAADSTYDVIDYPVADKRYARLSYSYGGSRPRGRYNSRYYYSRYYRNYYKPWVSLKDTECFRQRCTISSECCRKYSNCDKSAHVCYNCWYGHPCKSSRDCCERFPTCNMRRRMCQR